MQEVSYSLPAARTLVLLEEVRETTATSGDATGLGTWPCALHAAWDCLADCAASLSPQDEGPSSSPAAAAAAFGLNTDAAPPSSSLCGARTVVSLGDGTGLHGLAARVAGGPDTTVVLTDITPATLDNLTKNVARNCAEWGCAQAEAEQAEAEAGEEGCGWRDGARDVGGVYVRRLDWDDAEAGRATLRAVGFGGGGRADVVLGADLLYSLPSRDLQASLFDDNDDDDDPFVSTAPSLLAAVAGLLKPDGVCVLYCDEGRGKDVDKFLQLACPRFYAWKQAVPQAAAAHGDAAYASQRFRPVKLLLQLKPQKC
eukprot:Rhum_TRINITY_DN14135_c23_g1::Rhum_TRINITY_DN14135_c23_g1_i1::g.70553::m.70553